MSDTHPERMSFPKLLVLFLILPLLTTTHASSKKRCEPITIPLCQSLGYNMTSYPNSYGHERQEEAGLEVHQFYPLVEVQCYKHLKFFLCSMYTPICQDNYDLAILPCYEVCVEARRLCAPLMQQYGFKWPDTLICDRLPKMSEQEMTGNICAAPPDTPDPAADTEDYPPSSISSGNDVIRKNKHPVPADTHVGFPKVAIGIDVLDDTQCGCRCVRPFYVTRDSAFKVQNVSNCVRACHSETTEVDRNFLDTWISAWSGVCIALSAFTLLTFLTDLSRFPYPERPIFFLSVCQFFVSLGFVLRVVWGHDAVACSNENHLRSTLLPDERSLYEFYNQWSTPATSNSAPGGGVCLVVFFLIYFFGMAASAWWVVLSLSWMLAAVPHWSTEWIEKYSTYFHLFAWLLPGFQTFLVLMFNAVDGDPVSGICYVGNTNVYNMRAFVIGPLFIYLCVGVLFLSIGFLNLWGIRSNLRKTHPDVDKTSKLTQLMSKIGVFSVLYTLPAISFILVLFYEQNYRSLWEQSQLCPCAPQIRSNDKTILQMTLIKTASMLIVGWTSGVWLISAKTLQGWRRVLCYFCCCCCCDQESSRRRQGYYPANTRLSHNDDLDMIRQQHQPHHSIVQYSEHNGLPYQFHLLAANSNGTMNGSKTARFQPDLMYTSKRDSAVMSPMNYGMGSLRHCPALHTQGKI